ncbi:MAG TPA: metalloregulator ArsR/SmtB family transcription factor [Synergistales bacterium]|jgi:DNA-binding transcriptional ArsR family regulator|nr:metalloregulator ArsR/SmtB family transcription factor [Synergistales bacterium]HRV72000.1 metalloregulator ArsR/SmtB family transcription factor [Thermovirgaceae bacterium]
MEKVLVCVKALADIQRIKIAYALSKGELCLCSLQEFLGLSPSTVSRHVSIMKQAGMVESRTDGKWRYFRLIPDIEKTPCGDLLGWLIKNIENDPEIVAQAEQVSLMLEQQPEKCSPCNAGRRSC